MYQKTKDKDNVRCQIMKYKPKNGGYWNSSCHLYLQAFCKEMYGIDLYWRVGQEYD